MLRNILLVVGTILLLAVLIVFLPLDRVNWGRISILPAATITVTGTAQGDVANQIATYGASVTATNADKQTATDKVNTQMAALVTSVKAFGIADADIKTESINVYQQSAIYPVPPIRTGSGDWQASNSITITLRDVSKSSGLNDLLNKSGATNIYGPSLSVEPNNTADEGLLAKAVADAKAKAVSIAKAGGQTIGKMINVTENGSSYPMPMYAATKDSVQSGSGVSTPVQAGTTTLSKSVTVVFELK